MDFLSNKWQSFSEKIQSFVDLAPVRILFIYRGRSLPQMYIYGQTWMRDRNQRVIVVITGEKLSLHKCYYRIEIDLPIKWETMIVPPDSWNALPDIGNKCLVTSVLLTPLCCRRYQHADNHSENDYICLKQKTKKEKTPNSTSTTRLESQKEQIHCLGFPLPGWCDCTQAIC